MCLPPHLLSSLCFGLLLPPLNLYPVTFKTVLWVSMLAACARRDPHASSRGHHGPVLTCDAPALSDHRLCCPSPCSRLTEQVLRRPDKASLWMPSAHCPPEATLTVRKVTFGSSGGRRCRLLGPCVGAGCLQDPWFNEWSRLCKGDIRPTTPCPPHPRIHHQPHPGWRSGSGTGQGHLVASLLAPGLAECRRAPVHPSPDGGLLESSRAGGGGRVAQTVSLS